MKHLLSQLVPQRVKNLLFHLPMAMVASVWFGSPSKKLRVIGVTGTNGKTTTTKLITRILETTGHKVAMASTIEYQIGEKRWSNSSKFTTPSAWELNRFLHEARDEDCQFVILETSSHALDQYRVFGISYEVAVITNVTREHLDYHRTMDEYRRAKRKLFDRAHVAIVNLDMEQPQEFLSGKFEQVITYSTKNKEATVLAENISLDFKGSEFTALGKLFRLKLPGLMNIENALAAIAVGKHLGLNLDQVARALAEIDSVSGRMELVPNTRGIDIIIDYAVTPDAFKKLYEVVTPLKIPGTKIIHVFGACGERDRGKRPMMGRLASERSDSVILTNEDPYYEDPEQIIDEIEAGIDKKKLGENFYRIFDRREAIKKAIALAEEGDIILFTGKGAEESMAFGDKRVPWKERTVIEEELTKNTPGA